MWMSSLIRIGQSPAFNILENMRLWRVRSNALDMSVAQVNTSVPFFKK